MSAEQLEAEEPQVEVTDTPEPQEVEVPVDDGPVEQDNQKPEEQKSFDPKKDKVEFSTPEQQERFNEVFRMMKKSDQRNQMLTDFLEEQQRQLDELRGFTSEIKKEKIQTAQADAEQTLMTRIRQARDEGNDEAYDKAFAELTEFRTSKLFDEKVNEFRKQETVQADNDAKFVLKAMEETDETGNFLRPWLQENHEQFDKAIYQIRKIANKYAGDPQILEKTLKELDQVMSQKKDPPKEQVQSRAPNPMQGTNLTNQKPKGTIKMSRAEAEILKKLERHSGKKIDLKKYEARRTAMYEGQNRGGR